MLTLKNITWTAPDGHKVLKGIDLTIPDKKLVVITGPNGGGKTTLAKMIAGLEKPDTGSIELDGKDITNAGITERARMGIGFAFQQPVRFKGVTVADLMELATGKNDCGREACDYLVRVGLCAKDYLDREVDSTLSGGEIKRIELATVLARHTASVRVRRARGGHRSVELQQPHRRIHGHPQEHTGFRRHNIPSGAHTRRRGRDSRHRGRQGGEQGRGQGPSARAHERRHGLHALPQERRRLRR